MLPFYAGGIILFDFRSSYCILAIKHMGKTKREITIDSTIEEVWTKVTDFENMPTWFYGERSVTVLSDKLGIGTERIVTIITGQSYRERFVRWDAKRAFSYLVLDPPLFIKQWKAFVSLRPVPNGAVLRFEIHTEIKYGILGHILDRIILKPFLDIILLLSLRNLKKIIEN